MVYKKQQIKKICVECGSSFIADGRKIYCSRQCMLTRERNRLNNKYNQKVNEKKEELRLISERLLEGISIPQKNKMIICKNCNEEFITNKPLKIFCSNKCREKSNEKDRLFSDFEEPKSKNSLLKLRFELFKRDNFQCQYCGRTPRNDKCKLVIDHIILRAKGGTNEISNLITSCFECNAGKTDILLEERQIKKEVITYEKQ